MLPNYYQNYQNSQQYNYPNYTPYSNNYNTFIPQNQQSNIQSQQPMQQLPSIGLNGKIVDSEEIARVQEIPLGSYGIFPKADMSNIYVKTWNNDGTTRLISYSPIIDVSDKQIKENNIDTFDKRLGNIELMIESLDKKIDSISQPSEFIPINKRKKVNTDAE